MYRPGRVTAAPPHPMRGIDLTGICLPHGGLDHTAELDWEPAHGHVYDSAKKFLLTSVDVEAQSKAIGQSHAELFFFDAITAQAAGKTLSAGCATTRTAPSPPPAPPFTNRSPSAPHHRQG